MKKRVAFIAVSYIEKSDGISVYTENLLYALLQHERFENSIAQLDIYLTKNVFSLLKERLEVVKILDSKIKFITVSNKNFLFKMGDLYRKLLFNKSYDFVFAPNFMPLHFFNNTVKVIHDLSPEITPSLYSPLFRRYHAYLLKSGSVFDKAIAYISDSTKRDLERFYHIDETNTTLLYLPNGIPFKVQRQDRPSEDVLVKYEENDYSFLVVGRINKAKGFDRILSFCHYFDNYLYEQSGSSNAVLHVAGKQTKETKEIFRDANFKFLKVVFHGFVDDHKLNDLYCKTQFCFFLSRNEGYGLPLVEAMWFRCIPILSDIPIFREIMGDGYPMFNDKSGFTESVNKFLHEVLKNKENLKYVLDTLNTSVTKEQFGYQVSAENLIHFIEQSS